MRFELWRFLFWSNFRSLRASSPAFGGFGRYDISAMAGRSLPIKDVENGSENLKLLIKHIV
jgi:hypothetical protein